jgi:cell division protein FtsZ
MNRRTALKTLTVFSMAGFLPEFVRSNKPAAGKIHIVGIGGGGCNALEYIRKKGVAAEYTCISSPDRHSLPPGVSFIPYDSPKYYNLLEYQDDNLAIPAEIEKVFDGDATFVLLAGFGGFTGSNLTRALAGYLSKGNKRFMIICSMPFSFEGERRKRIALNTRRFLEHFTSFRCLEMETIRVACGNLPLSVAFEKADEEFYDIFRENIMI